MPARVIGLTLLGLGGVALAVALLAPAVAATPVPEIPADEESETVVSGTDVTFLDPLTLEQRTGEDVSISVRVRGGSPFGGDAAGDGAAGDGAAGDDTAVRVHDTTTSAADGMLISTTTTTVCLDRRTAEAVDCAAEAVDGRRTDVRGLVLTFPPATPERDRMMWDGTARASFPVRFVGTERFRGLEVQRYEHVVPEQVVRSAPVPGRLVGSPEETAPADVVYSATRALLVEPVSGVVVARYEVLLTTLRSPDGTPGAVLLGGAFGSSEESVTGALARAEDVLDRRVESGSAVPWTAGSAGVVLLGLGGSLLARARTRALPVGREADGAVPQPVPVG